MSAGQNTCALLAEVQLQSDAIWANPAKNKDYIANVGTIDAIRKNQTVRISELEDPDKDKTVKLYWPQNCDDTTQSCSDDCSPGGNEPETSCQTHTLDLCREVNFSLEEKAYRSIATTFEEALAVTFLRKIKSLDEYIARTTVSKLDSFKGVNGYTGGKGTVSGFETNVSPAYWNATLLSYFALVGLKNKFTSPYILSGTNLFEQAWMAEKNSGNGDGKGAKSMFDSMPTYFDIFNIDSQLDPDKATFMIDSNAVAFVSKTYYPFAPGSPESEKWGGVGSSVGMKYQMESKNLPGVFYDITYKIVCSSNKIYHNFNVKFYGGIFRNPVGCTPNNTGILKFVCE